MIFFNLTLHLHYISTGKMIAVGETERRSMVEGPAGEMHSIGTKARPYFYILMS